MEVLIMARKVNLDNVKAVLETIQDKDSQIRANDIAKILNLHPQAISRLLPAVDDETDELLCEDDQGFLSIFKSDK